jgi:hypothetical protein
MHIRTAKPLRSAQYGVTTVSRSDTYPTSVDDFPSAPREVVRSLVDSSHS